MHLLDLNNYFLNPYAIPPFVTCIIITALIVFFLMMEGVSLVSVSLTMMAMTFLSWFLTDGMMYVSANVETALSWAGIGYWGLTFLPAASFQCTFTILGLYKRYKRIIFSAWAVSFLFLILSQTSDQFIKGAVLRWWGYYTIYGSVGIAFTLYTFAVFVYCAFHFIQEYKRSASSSLQ